MASKEKILKLIVGTFTLVIFSELTYEFGLMITGMFLGDLDKAQNAVYFYSFIHKILLAILTGALIGTFFMISKIFYDIALTLFGKGE